MVSITSSRESSPRLSKQPIKRRQSWGSQMGDPIVRLGTFGGTIERWAKCRAPIVEIVEELDPTVAAVLRRRLAEEFAAANPAIAAQLARPALLTHAVAAILEDVVVERAADRHDAARRAGRRAA
jgi:hypothetical protein